jgi:L-iditol 2-dehydrogenase
MKKNHMLGLVKTAKGSNNMEVREVPIPSLQPNEVLLEIKAAGICGTDIHIKHDLFPYWPPVIMGHEFSGVIVEIGEEVTGYKLGQRVVGEPHTRACGKCELCRTGNIQICASKRSPGWGIDGAFAQYLAIPEHLLHPIPDRLSDHEAALVEPIANVVQDVLENTPILPNDTVVVIGPGPIGLVALMCAKSVSAGKLFMIGTSADLEIRMPLAEKIGVDVLLQADKEDIVAAVNCNTNGRGVDIVIEASGAPAAIASTPHLVRKLGTICQIGLTGLDQISFPWDTASKKACKIQFNMSTAFTCWDRAIGMMTAGVIDASLLISDVFPLAEWKQAFEKVESKQAIKALLIP